SQRVCRLGLVAVFGRLRVERHERLFGSALAGLLAGAVVEDVVTHRGQQERAEAAELGPNVLQAPVLDETREVALRHVARLLGPDTLAAYERVGRIPLGLAKTPERVARRRALALRRGEHDGPA